MVSEAMLGRPGNVRKSRGWLDASGDITDVGRAARGELERRTNEDSLTMWSAVGDEGAVGLGALLAPASNALLQADYFAAIGRPAK